MSKYSVPCPETGAYVDLGWKKRRSDTLVYAGALLIGQIFKSSEGYSAVSSWSEPQGMRAVSGFRTRWKATVYLLRACGSYKEFQ